MASLDCRKTKRWHEKYPFATWPISKALRIGCTWPANRGISRPVKGFAGRYVSMG